ncbi:unnamed protein product [Allacma fusca]|uniref:Carboxylesterase type B domain-containing protein n=1 Tax=Allacma fusca TaxID=39272 RepID=A0A8J2KMJ4_9HEXA|nr:unnamed protein product [Allacma fusca]
MCRVFSPASRIKLVLLTITAISYFGESYSELSVNEDSVIATTLQGKLRGKILQSRGSRDYFAFQGIPYATVNGRFQPPGPPESWEDVRNATDFGAECPQIEHFTGDIVPNSVDCLFLNVFVPDLKGNYEKKLPILLQVCSTE